MYNVQYKLEILSKETTISSRKSQIPISTVTIKVDCNYVYLAKNGTWLVRQARLLYKRHRA